MDRNNNKIRGLKNFALVLIQVFVISGITVFAVAPSGCKVSETGIEVVGGDYSAPVLQNVNVVSASSVILEFSEQIQLTSAVVSPAIPGISDSIEHSYTEFLSPSLAAATGKYGAIDSDIQLSDDCKAITFNFKSETIIGKSYHIMGVVKDKTGNSLTFSVPFTGYNSRIPDLIFTEIHTGMASQLNSEKSRNIRRLEYIELLALNDGNLVGLELCSGLYGEGKKYEFPPIEVHKGEVIVFHPRIWGEGCISEEGDEFNLAYSEYTSDSWRDLWAATDSRIIGEKTDILVIKNSITGKIMDAVMYCEESLEEWNTKLKTDYSVNPDIAEIYPGGDVEYAVITDETGNKLTASNSLQRCNKTEIMQKLANGEVVEYPIVSDKDSWKIDKVSLPLRQ